MTHAMRGGLVRAAAALLVVALLGACSTPVPNRQKDLCAVFDQFPEWYDHALASRKRWGTPIPVLMSIIHHESGYRSHVRPPMKWFLGIIPLGRPSTAKGYAQAISPAWKDYTSERGGTFRSRTDMEDASRFRRVVQLQELEGTRHPAKRRTPPVPGLSRGPGWICPRVLEEKACGSRGG